MAISIGLQAGEIFPALIPKSKPKFPLSAATERLYDKWNPHEDRANELYSNFKYSSLEGFPHSPLISRRDPTKIIKIGQSYHVWYTRRHTHTKPRGPQFATETRPSYDWDLCDIWHATSKDGFNWKEVGPAVERLPKPRYGWRSISTPDILAWKGKFYLYYQGFNEIPGKISDRAAVSVAVSDSVWGPFKAHGEAVVDFGAPGDWDSNAIHDPFPVVFNEKIYLFYKGSAGTRGANGTLIRAQGLAIATHPLGPFEKSQQNPVINSGHETAVFPWQEGLAALVSLDGPEKNTVQYSPDGIDWQIKSIIQVPPIAPGPFISDAYADNKNGRGITWGLCHVMDKKAGYSRLMRFDCDLSLDVDRPHFKHNNLRFNQATYFQEGVRMRQGLKKNVLHVD